MADSEALINQTSEDVRSLHIRVSGIERDMTQLVRSIERLNTNLEWHNRIATVVGGLIVATLIPTLFWLAKELYALNGAVAGLRPLQPLMESIASKLLQQ